MATKTYRKSAVDDNGLWLLIVPKRTSEIEKAIVAVMRVEECWVHPTEKSPGGLLWATCSLTLSCGDALAGKKQTVTAKYTSKLGGSLSLELFNDDYILNEFLTKGVGIGTWIMQQIVTWTRTLPPETPVAKIWMYSGDEKKRENVTRRDSLWHGLGFRFQEGHSTSQPLCAGELQMPKGRHSTLIVLALPAGVGRLVSDSQQQTLAITNLLDNIDNQKERIKHLEQKQCRIQLNTGIWRIILSPVLWTALIISTFWFKVCH